MHDKPTLRQHMREHLRAIDESTRQQAGARIAQHILRSGMRQLAETAPHKVIALFGGLKNEPDLLPHLLPVLWDQGHRPCFFQIEASELQPRHIQSLDDLQRGQMNVWEPKPHCPPVEIAALDLILVPGLAFTRDGARLGRGGGYYDRLLAHPHCRANRLAIAYDCQIIDHIPVEPHDQRVHQIITESGLIQAPAPH
jgi:5-formyltetrahydrofolate cyclo-ligase|uniref:5-formyltetrahydrofolate cyclo-ligase n=1 Tax=Prosthecobacter sp. TaxID=1965333 RepID=UPI0037835AC8